MNLEDRYEKKHQGNLAAIERLITLLYKAYTGELAKIGATLSKPGEDTVFSFKDYPSTRKKVNELLHKMTKDLNFGIVNGIDSEWTLANNKNNELSNVVFGDMKGKLSEEQYARYYGTNEAARDAFKVRKIEGITLSERVWNLTDQFKGEMELAIDLGLRDGLPADEMSRALRQYLKEPNKLFRRVRDERGQLVLSKAAKAYHPGRGVYRSSYMNARRLAVTEGNIAFHTADYLRTQKEDFVVGIKIVLSNNHTCLGADRKPHPFYDICDELQGKYPKDFKFTGWHPHCRCSVIKILKTEKEIDEENERYLNGEIDHFSEDSVNKVEHCPRKFDKWLKDNEKRIKTAKSVPYFIKDNPRYIFKDGIDKGEPETLLTIKQRAEQRHAARTKEDIRRIQDMADERTYGKEYVNKIHEMEQILGVKRGKRMTFEQADKQNANPNHVEEFLLDPNGVYADKKGNRYSLNPKYIKNRDEPFEINCQTCAPAYMLRILGFPVTAKGNTPGSLLENLSRGKSLFAWTDVKGNIEPYSDLYQWMSKKGYKQMNKNRYLEFWEEHTKEEGIYEITINWKKRGAHTTILQRFKDGTLKYIEPQHDNSDANKTNAATVLEDMAANGALTPKGIRGIIRIDDKFFDVRRWGKIFEIH